MSNQLCYVSVAEQKLYHITESYIIPVSIITVTVPGYKQPVHCNVQGNALTID